MYDDFNIHSKDTRKALLSSSTYAPKKQHFLTLDTHTDV